MQRRWVIFGPLGVVGAAALVALLAPGLRRRDETTDSGPTAPAENAADGPPAGETADVEPDGRGTARLRQGGRLRRQSAAAPYTSSSAPTGSNADRSTSSSNSATASSAGGVPTLATATRPIAGEM